MAMDKCERLDSFSSYSNASESSSILTEKITDQPALPFRPNQKAPCVFRPWQNLKHIYQQWQAYLRTRRIDNFLNKDSKRRFERILLLGDSRLYNPWFYAVQKCEIGPLNASEQLHFKSSIFNVILEAMQHRLYVVEESKLSFDSESSKKQADIITCASRLEDNMKTFPDHLAQAISLLWADSTLRSTYENFQGHCISCCPRSYFDQFERISSSEYIPSEEDIRYVYKTGKHLQCHSSITFEEKDASWLVTEIAYHGGERKKWIHHYENFSSILYTVDLPCYVNILSGCSDEYHLNFMKEQMYLYQSIVNSRWFTGSNIALCFINNHDFCQLVEKKPIDKYFENCEVDDPSNPDQAREFIVKTFLAFHKTPKTRETTVHIIDGVPGKEDWVAVKAFIERSSRKKRPSNKFCGLRWPQHKVNRSPKTAN